MATTDTIDPLAPVPGRINALSALPVDRSDPARWITGFQFQPELCKSGDNLALNCLGDAAQMANAVHPATVDGSGWMVYTYDKCSTLGWQAADYEARARRQLQANESYLFAKELWTGAKTGAASTNTLPKNRALADSNATAVTTGTAVSPLIALSLLDNAIAVCGANRRGFIHMRPQLLMHLASVMAVRREGSVWLTPLDNAIVADGGYLGSSPATPTTNPTTDQWMIGTSWLQVRIGTPMVQGGPNAQGVDRSINNVETWAFEPVMYQWDECCHYSAQVNVAPSAPHP